MTKSRHSHSQLIVFALFFAAVGGFLLYKSFALNPNLPGDVNNDNTVNITDLSILLSNYNTNYPAADFNSDGVVSILDMSVVLSNYNKTYTPPSPTPPPPPPANPPPPPPSGGGTVSCLVSNATSWQPEDCTAGTTIEVTNQGWHCDRALSQYGKLPIKVLVKATTKYSDAGAVTLDAGCRGDSNSDTVDLIGFAEGDGAHGTRGNGVDAFKTRQTPQDIQVTGRFECGPQTPDAHQDMVQFQGGTNITLVNVTSGNWDTGRATCMGAGGIIYTDGGTNINIVHSFFVGCNHGIIRGDATQNIIRDSGSRSGRTDGSDPNCIGFAASDPCSTGATYINVVCERWRNGGWVKQNFP